MIREVSRKELLANRALLAIALGVVVLVTAAIPFFFDYSLKRAVLSVSNETTRAVLQNFRSYPVYIESQWLARNLARILSLLALLAGAGAIAGERENRTLPLLYRASVPLSSIAFVKFVFIAVWLGLVTFASSAVLAVYSLVGSHPFPLIAACVISIVAWANAIAFLGVVFAASSLASRTAVAAALALAAGFLVALALAPLDVNGTALALNIVGSDGAIDWSRAGADLLIAAAIAGLGLLVATIEVERRRAT